MPFPELLLSLQCHTGFITFAKMCAPLCTCNTGHSAAFRSSDTEPYNVLQNKLMEIIRVNQMWSIQINSRALLSTV